MPRRTLSFLLTLVASTLPVWTADGLAQTIPSPYRFVDTRHEVGVFGGANFSVAAGQFGIGPGPGPVVGLRYAIALGGPFAIEAVGTYMDSSRDVLDPGADGEFTKVGEADAQLLMLEGRLRFNLLGRRTWHRISPYLLVGGGATFELAGQQAADLLVLPADRYNFGNSFSGVMGAGTQWYVSDRVLLRTDLRLQLWQQDIPAGYRVRDLLVAAPEKEWIQAWGLTFGAAYLL